jgi:hypothetical protein
MKGRHQVGDREGEESRKRMCPRVTARRLAALALWKGGIKCALRRRLAGQPSRIQSIALHGLVSLDSRQANSESQHAT